MRGLIAAVFLAVAGISAAGCASSGALIERDEVMSVARDMTDAYARAWTANDMARFGALHLPDARHVNLSGTFLRGREAIVETHQSNRRGYPEGARMAARLEGARAITDDTIVAVTILEIGNSADDASPQRLRLTMTIVWREGNWHIAQAHASQPVALE